MLEMLEKVIAMDTSEEQQAGPSHIPTPPKKGVETVETG
jgi:hypothetical protein